MNERRNVGQAFQPAGSPGFPARYPDGRLESRPNRQTGKSAPHIPRSLRDILVLSVWILMFIAAPAFAQTNTPNPRVRIETELGNIVVELNLKEAPVTVRNFLRYVDRGFYADARFFRTVTPSNQPNNQVKIQVVQVECSPRAGKAFVPIPLERTRDTGLRHRDGTLSMARDGPDTAENSFSICVGDQPELDFGGKRNPDGQGFAAFGRVTEGMDIVRKIHASPARGQQLTPPIRIVRIVPLPEL